MHHVFDFIIVGGGDEGVEVFAGELVLEGEVLWQGAAEGSNEDLSVIANIEELVVMGAGRDLVIVATHELGLVFFVLLLVPWRWVLIVNLV